MQTTTVLPIDPYLPELIQACQTHSGVIVRAEPGAGKTTRLPRALMAVVSGRIIVLEPRRLAARLSAERVAEELGESVGQRVGYQMRFASAFSSETRIIYMTEGLFLRLLQDNPTLKGVVAIILDEFHERHIHSDVALALTLKLQRSKRPDLKLIVMSATIDTTLLASHLDPAKVFDIPGRTFPVAIEYRPESATLPTEIQVANAVKMMFEDARCPGNILVFLAGIQEIRRCEESLLFHRTVHDIDIYALTADLAFTAREKIFAPRTRRMIVLATNVAETSVTLPNITGVIDTGRAKIAGIATWSGMPTLELKPISQASAIQRAGRAGRTAPGVTYRLYSEGDFRARAPFLAPEIQRLDLTATCLEILSLCELWGEPPVAIDQALPWLEKPDAKSVARSMQLLVDLGAMTPQGRPTQDGLRMARMPLHPRLARTMLKGESIGCSGDARLLACLVSEGFIAERSTGPSPGGEIDLSSQLKIAKKALQNARGDKDLPLSMLPSFISPQRLRQVIHLYHALQRQTDKAAPDQLSFDENILGELLLAGFPDRVGKLRPVPKEARSSGRDGLLYNLVTGGGGVLAPASSVKGSPWIIAIEAEEATGKNADQAVVIRMAVPVETRCLSTSQSPYLAQRTEAVWAEEAQRVDIMDRRLYGTLVVDETRVPVANAHGDLVVELLLTKLREHWPKPFPDDADLKTYHARALLLGKWNEKFLPLFDVPDMLELLQADICDGKRTFKEIAEKPLKSYLDDQLSWEEKSLLDQEVPLSMRLENGRTFAIQYDADRPPYIAGYVQDFYGVQRTPTLMQGRVNLTLEIRGPNKRPVQVTSDLPGFWGKIYPQLRSDLGRNYPRHYWPEIPQNAEPHLHKSRASAPRP